MSNFADEIVKILAPVVGTGLATSAVTMQCRKMGIIPEDLSPDNIEDFTKRFIKPLEIFAGDEIALMLIKKINQIT